ncbi:MAG: hypothetical protein LBH01_02030 [Verrucomicrobiales bacterium]|jgi:hypothetical protein|nr:hypothetical protein [Verrucomicrobiales bacterium]
MADAELFNPNYVSGRAITLPEYHGKRKFHSCTLYGFDGLLLADGVEITTDRYGLDTSECLFSCPTDKVLQFRNSGLTNHPIFAWLEREKQTIKMSPGLSAITCYYAGILDINTEPVYELCIGEAQEPIETHPEFVSKIGGKPSVPLNGAIFLDKYGNPTDSDAEGIFERFRIWTGEAYASGKNRFAGVSSYMDASQVRWKKNWCSVIRPYDITSLSDINYPEGPYPSLGKGRNWRYVGLTYQQRGLCYTITKEWQASGAGGWIPQIYS